MEKTAFQLGFTSGVLRKVMDKRAGVEEDVVDGEQEGQKLLSSVPTGWVDKLKGWGNAALTAGKVATGRNAQFAINGVFPAITGAAANLIDPPGVTAPLPNTPPVTPVTPTRPTATQGLGLGGKIGLGAGLGALGLGAYALLNNKEKKPLPTADQASLQRV